MSRDGQSLGKKIMGIRVLKSDGSNPGFGGTVLIREVAWSFIVGIIVIAVMLAVNDTHGWKPDFSAYSLHQLHHALFRQTRPPHAL